MMLASSLYSITQGAGAPCFVVSNDGSLTTTRGHDPFFVLADFCLDTLFVQQYLRSLFRFSNDILPEGNSVLIFHTTNI